jgi:hypothetical protein
MSHERHEGLCHEGHEGHEVLCRFSFVIFVTLTR